MELHMVLQIQSVIENYLTVNIFPQPQLIPVPACMCHNPAFGYAGPLGLCLGVETTIEANGR
jgi:hypothetical protein